MESFTKRRMIAVVRWTARTIGIALLGLIAAFAIGEGGPNPLTVSLRENLIGVALLTMIVGQIVAWKWEGMGSLLILGGFALFAIVNHGVRLNSSFVVYVPWLVTGLLYLICWWRTPTTVGRVTRIILAVACILTATLLAGWIAFSPLRRSDDGVRAWLLAKTPLGSSLAEVRPFLEQHGWNDERFQQTMPPPATKPFLGGKIGSYQGFPWYTSVRAFWEFDSSNRLVNIRIERVYDSP